MHPFLLLALGFGDPAPNDWNQERLEAASAEIQAQVEELRGAKFKRPVKVQMSDTKSLRAYIEKREAEMASPARLHRDECAAKLLGLVEPGFDLRAFELEILESQVGGFYDPKSDTFFLMEGLKGAGARIILAHELTHALDDQLFDLDKALIAANEVTDAELTIRSVIEGSGTNLMYRWLKAHGNAIPMADLQAFSEMGADVLKRAPPLLWKPLLASYSAGDAFLARTGGMNLTQKAAESTDVERAFREPPRSTEQILHPDAYWNDAERDEPTRVEYEAGAIPAGWTELAQDTLGEMVLALATTPPAERKGLDMSNPVAILGLSFTNKAAKGWDGDRAILLGRGDDRFLQISTVWDSADDAAQFLAAMEKSAPKLFTAARDDGGGWVPRFTPTHYRVALREGTQSPLFVVVRVASLAKADDAEFAALSVPWETKADADVRPSRKSAEDGR